MSRGHAKSTEAATGSNLGGSLKGQITDDIIIANAAAVASTNSPPVALTKMLFGCRRSLELGCRKITCLFLDSHPPS